MKITFLTIILPFMVYFGASNGSDVLWSDDKSTNAFNCDGFVTDAICCQDDLCNGHDENSCNSGDKKSIFCKWDKFFSKCLAFRDAENNVCCQSKPVAGCSDLIECYHFVSILNSSYFFFCFGTIYFLTSPILWDFWFLPFPCHPFYYLGEAVHK